MNAKFRHRFAAYLIDIIILGLILTITSPLFINDKKISMIESELDTINEMFITKQLEPIAYIEQYSTLTYNLDKAKISSTVLNILFITCFLVILPYISDGQTIGKKIMKIKIVSKNQNKLTISTLLIRNIIINGLGYMILVIIFLNLLPSDYYFIVISFLGFIQFLLVIISTFMVLYRSDKRGLQDILSNTKVIYQNKDI